MEKQELKEHKLTIKLVPNPDNPNIPVKYVNAIEYATPKTAKDGKTITGLDELALSITKLPEGEQKIERNSLKKLRESLENLLGVDLTPSSIFWNDFVIFLEDDIILDPENPRDKLNEKFLVANGYVAPSLEASRNDERYMNCMFYIHREKEEIANKTKKQKLIDKATSKLFLLNEDDPNKLKLVASYIFGFDISANIDSDEAYLKLKDYISAKEEGANQKNNIETFLAACNKSPEEIMIKKILDKAIKKRIVVQRNNVFRRDDEEYGATYEEAHEYLQLPENSGELASLRKKVGI